MNTSLLFLFDITSHTRTQHDNLRAGYSIASLSGCLIRLAKDADVGDVALSSLTISSEWIFQSQWYVLINSWQITPALHPAGRHGQSLCLLAASRSNEGGAHRNTRAPSNAKPREYSR